MILTELLFFLMIIKHFICDFPLQYPRHYLHKGKYLHLGGIEHAAIHGAATVLILNPWLGLLDFVIHYHIDWAKMGLNSHYGWKCNTSEKFWTLLGVDQLLHYLTYVVLIHVYTHGWHL